MILNKMLQKSFILAVALAAAFALAAVWPTAAAAAAPECTLIGTWAGNAGSPLAWLGVHTPGNTLTKGEMLLNWLRVKNELLIVYGSYPTVTRLSDGRGVWEQTARGKYKYTWYAYGNEALSDYPVYSVRVSGLANLMDCNSLSIAFNYEVFDGFLYPHQMSEATPIGGIVDYAAQTRVPLTVVTPPE
jgi:hypothetical protein